MTKQRIRIKPPARAEAYYSGKEQMVSALARIANHLYNPPRAQRKKPEQVTAQDILKIKQAYRLIREVGDLYGLSLNAGDI